jgi:2-polyprenyl-3-methyl-5-hydroxy-6-metoxy-1,4-benzoquinol methylase
VSVLFPDLSRREHVPERMDDPNCDRACLLRTLRGFGLLNRLVSRYRSVLERLVLRDMQARPERTYRVADLGAGGGDIAAWLLRRSRELGLEVSVLAVESDPVIADFAERTHGGMHGLSILRQDATDLRAIGPVDYVIGNHFLHHLDDAGIVALLRSVLELPVRRFVFLDLIRSRAAYAGISVLGFLLFPRTFIGVDGRRSIRRGFRPDELGRLFEQHGIAERVEIRSLAPARLAVSGRGNDPDSASRLRRD